MSTTVCSSFYRHRQLGSIKVPLSWLEKIVSFEFNHRSQTRFTLGGSFEFMMIKKKLATRTRIEFIKYT